MVRFLCVGLWLFLFTPCDPVAAASDRLQTLQISQAYLRQMPPGQSVTSAYLVLSNRGDAVCTLVDAVIDLADRIEFHRHTYVDGVMQMRRVDQLLVAPGEDLIFQPGGLHMMVFNPDRIALKKRPAKLTLRTLNCGEVVTAIPLRHRSKKTTGWRIK